MTLGHSVGRAAVSPPASRRTIEYKPIGQLSPHPRNARRHSPKQIQQLAESIRRFGFNVPVLIDSSGRILAGHARVLAAKRLGFKDIPTICLDGLSDAEARAFMLADNKLTLNSEWDERFLAEELKELSEMNLDFSLELTGFELPEIDFRIQGISLQHDGEDPADEIPDLDTRVQVTQPGDLWALDRHRVLCADSRQQNSFQQLMQTNVAGLVFADPPYNVRIDGHVSGKGACKHRDFAMASGEMSEQEFTDFLQTVFRLVATHSRDGSLCFVCMDWRHMQELLASGKQVFSQLKNVCVWGKDRPGMGSLYRSQYELVFLFKNGTAPHVNNIQLGKFGRCRTNLWQYPSAVSFGRSGEEENLLASHPTPKPCALVADAILDCSNRGDIVLDPFLGSGTTVIAAERTGRICFGLEVDPAYTDVTLRRWRTFTGKDALHVPSGRTFSQIEEEVKRG